MMKLTEIYAILKTHKDVLKYAREVATKQHDVKRTAIDRVIEHYERTVNANDKFECWYTPLVDYRCKKCGGVIMKVVGPFPSITFGGNPAVGCIMCSTVGSAKMLALRTDIVHKGD
jgi:uncharacterized membrane protein